MKNKKLDTIVDIAYSTKKGLIIIVLDIFISWLLFGISIDEYIAYKFYEKKMKLRKKYISKRKNKLFYENIENDNNIFKEYKDVIKREYYLNNETINKLERFLSNNKDFQIRAFNDLYYNEYKKSKEIKDTEGFYNLLKENNLYLEQLINQDKKMNMLSDNQNVYLKVITFSNKNKSEILYSYITFSLLSKKCNISIEVDTKFGKLKGIGICDDLSEYRKVPGNKTSFDKFQISNWEKIKLEIIDIAALDKNDIVVEWTYMISKNEIELINKSYNIDFKRIQIVSQRGRKDIINHVINNIKSR